MNGAEDPYGLESLQVVQYDADTKTYTDIGELVTTLRGPDRAAVVVDTTTPTEAPPLLEVREVTVRFGGMVALDELSFSIREGDICGLIGPNGAGKTTCFNVVSRIYQPTVGPSDLRRARPAAPAGRTTSPASASPGRSRTWPCSRR